MTPAATTPRTKRDFLALTDLSRDEIDALLARAGRLKRGEEGGRLLEGKTLAMIFRKSSTRTRVSFEAGMVQLGGHAIFLADRDTQIGRGEPLADTARVLSGYVDAIMMRTYLHDDVEEMARNASIPVINGLTDRLHPCQLLADLLTLVETFGPDLAGRRVAWIGDGNNVAHSWINAARLMGLELRIACPEGFDPDPTLLADARADGAGVTVVRDPAEAADGVHVVSTDVWASMGQEDDAARRAEAFRGFRVDTRLMDAADPDAVFLHCLPAHRGEEVTAEVIDGPRSRVFDEAENRLHAQKALLLALLEGR